VTKRSPIDRRGFIIGGHGNTAPLDKLTKIVIGLGEKKT
jgi:hypothetical protein